MGRRIKLPYMNIEERSKLYEFARVNTTTSLRDTINCIMAYDPPWDPSWGYTEWICYDDALAILIILKYK